MIRVVDLFAGWGGFTLAAESRGHRVVWAANHWPLAVDAHALNHPHTHHECQDLRQADWTSLPAYDLLVASPACQGHSEASQPRRRAYHDEMRATAWAVTDCIEVTRPRFVVVENVPRFRKWKLYPLWLEAFRRLGYATTENVTTASRFGVPQRRARFFLCARLGRRAPNPIVEPLVAEPAFGPCVEWDEGEWRPFRDAQPGARERLEVARRRLGRRALVQHVTGHRGIPLTEPIRTITTKDQWHVIDGDRYRPLTVRENARAQGFPDSYAWPASATRGECVIGIGNAVSPPQAATAIDSAIGRRMEIAA